MSNCGILAVVTDYNQLSVQSGWERHVPLMSQMSIDDHSSGQIVATSQDRFPPKGSFLEGKWDPLFQSEI